MKNHYSNQGGQKLDHVHEHIVKGGHVCITVHTEKYVYLMKAFLGDFQCLCVFIHNKADHVALVGSSHPELYE